MGVDAFTIVLQGGPVFYPGNQIQGTVIIDISGESVKMNDVKIKMVGGVRVHWSEDRTERTGDKEETITDYYSANMDYFNLTQTLFGSLPGAPVDSGYKVLHPGRTALPFIFQLPQGGLSTSLEGLYGSIRYWLEAKIDMPWYKFNKTVEYPFTVIAQPVSPQEQYALMAPQERANEKSVCCLCCKSGSIMMYVKINRQWFCPGESAVLEAHVENGSGRNLTLNARLKQTQEYIASCGRTKTIPAVMSKSGTLANILEHNTVTQTCYFLIPTIPPSIRDCPFIKVSYALKINVDVPGGLDLSVEIPIVVGTPNQYQQNHLPPSTTITWNNPAPPTYEESMANVTPPKLDWGERTAPVIGFKPVYGYWNSQSDPNVAVPSCPSLPYEENQSGGMLMKQ